MISVHKLLIENLAAALKHIFKHLRTSEARYHNNSPLPWIKVVELAAGSLDLLYKYMEEVLLVLRKDNIT